MPDISANLAAMSPVIITASQGRLPVVKSSDAEMAQALEPRQVSSDFTISTSRYSPAYGKAKQIIQMDFSNPLSAGQSSKDILQNAVRGSAVGGVSRLSELLEKGDSEYKQDMRQYSTFSFPTKSGDYAPLDLDTFQDIDSDPVKGITLELKTKDGDSISFSLEQYKGYGVSEGETEIDERGFHITDKRHGSFTGVKVDFSFEGHLSSDEKLQLEALVAKLEGLHSGYLERGELSLGEFDFSTFDLMSDVDIALSNEGKEVFAFKYHDDELKRTIEFGNTNITIDKTSLGMGFTVEQQEKAKQSYLNLIKEAAVEVKYEQDVGVMQDVFNLGFSNLANKEDANENLSDDSPQKIIADSSEQVKSSLITLPDFDFSHQSKMDRPNAASRPEEYRGFKLNISLSSQVHEDESKKQVDIVQEQKFKLVGAYYEPLDHLEQVDFTNQNYKYTTVSRETEKVNHLLIQDGLIEKAQSVEDVKGLTSTKEYNEGDLVDEINDAIHLSNYQNFTELAKQQDDEQNQEMLETLIIDPYQKTNESDGSKSKFGKQLELGELADVLTRLRSGVMLNI